MESAFGQQPWSVSGKKRSAGGWIVSGQQGLQQLAELQGEAGEHQDKRLCTAACAAELGRSSSLESDATHLNACLDGRCSSPSPQHTGLFGYSSQDSGASSGGHYIHPEAAAAAEAEAQKAVAADDEPARKQAWLQSLEEANRCVATMPLPGGYEYVPVSPDCITAKVGQAYDLPAIAIALASSYFQRLLMRNKAMRAAAAENGFFAHNGTHWEMRATAANQTLISVYCTCILLAVKVSDNIPFPTMLSHMLGILLGHEVPMEQLIRCSLRGSPLQVAELERACLRGLNWRLGPYFNKDML